MPQAVRLLLEGFWVTVELTLAGGALAVVCALCAGLARLSRDPILRWLATGYVEVFRGTSALVQLFWFYYAFPLLIGLSLPAMAAGVLVLGLNVGAYGAEVVRGALLAVPRGQHEAAVALGFSRSQRMRHVIVPQAVLPMLPPAGNLAIELLKASALVSMITIADLTYAAGRIREHTLQTGVVYGVALLLYFALASALAAAVRGLERRLARGRDYGGAA